MTGTVNDLLAQARASIGYNGQGSCDSPVSVPGTWYGMQGQWCDMAVSYWLARAGVAPDPLGKHPKGYAWVPAHAQAFKDAGRWISRNGAVKPGDVVFYDWDGTQNVANCDHVGIVETVHSDGTIGTIEGNTDDPSSSRYSCGNCCRRKVRNRSYVVGFGRPAYKSATPAPKPVPKPSGSGTTIKQLEAIGMSDCVFLRASKADYAAKKKPWFGWGIGHPILGVVHIRTTAKLNVLMRRWPNVPRQAGGKTPPTSDWTYNEIAAMGD